jgi:hypothetical protein
VPSDERLEDIVALVALRSQIRDLRHAVRRLAWLVVGAILTVIVMGLIGVLIHA